MAEVENWKTELLVIQATPFCNLDCSYCYLPDRNNHRRMSLPTLRKVFERMFESPFLGRDLTVVWHSGEPLVVPPDFYRDAFALATEICPARVALAHSFQTNGTLIDDRWADFIIETGARIGVSIDGPKEIHDRHRHSRSGAGSYDRTMAGIRVLQRRGVTFHVITVLTAESISQPDALYRFYRNNDIRQVCFNIEEVEADNSASSLDNDDAGDQFRSFLRCMLDLVKHDGPDRLWVREFASASTSIARYTAPGARNPQTTPFAIVSVDTEGNVSTFSPELLGAKSAHFGDFIIGNVHHQSMLEMSRSLPFARMYRDIKSGVEACRRDCAYFGLCGGGAPANKLFETGSFTATETMYCRLCRQAVVDVVLEDMETGLGIGRATVSANQRTGA